MRVLCIDDSKSVHAFLKSCLEGLVDGFDSLYDGQEAVDFYKSGKLSGYDLIFLDWEMPRMTGPDFFAFYKTTSAKIPVVMLTSKNDVNDMVQMLDAGVVDYVLKPFTRDIIREKFQQNAGRSI